MWVCVRVRVSCTNVRERLWRVSAGLCALSAYMYYIIRFVCIICIHVLSVYITCMKSLCEFVLSIYLYDMNAHMCAYCMGMWLDRYHIYASLCVLYPISLSVNTKTPISMHAFVYTKCIYVSMLKFCVCMQMYTHVYGTLCVYVYVYTCLCALFPYITI